MSRRAPGAALWRLALLPLAGLEDQRGHLFPWTPVCLGAGIAAWFALPVEPGPAALGALAALALALGLAGLHGADSLRPVALALALAAAGVALAGARAAQVAEPVLGFRYHGPVEGRIVGIDRSGTDRLRLTLDRVVLERTDPAATPARVRVSLHDPQDRIGYAPGQTVILTAHLQPPNGAIEPGGFDFRRHAWFEGLGAVGYSRTPVLLLAPAEPGPSLWIDRLRQRLATAIRGAIPGDAGALAAAVTTGDRSGLSADANQTMRDSNLYHIVSISGMHMGMLAAIVFGTVRAALALVPPLALRLPGKKIAAVVALAAAAFYLALAGRDIATERSFVMVAVVLAAVLCDRRAFSLRSVAVAGCVVLVLRPEALLNPGFQMSFAATAALVAAFEALARLPEAPRRWLRWAMPVLTLVLSSLVAGLATAPYAAAHFNRMAEYGLIANLLAVPAMGFLVMPGAVLLAVAGPLGLGQPAVWMMEAGSRWVLFVAERVAAIDGAVSATTAPPAAFLPLVTLGGLVAVLWRGRGRIAGAVPAALAFALWAAAERPALLIDAEGALVGVMTTAGRALSKPSESLAARGWIENDGEMSAEAAGARPGFTLRDGSPAAVVGGVEVVHVFGRGWRERLAPACRPGRLVVTPQEAGPLPGGCRLLDAAALRRTGAVAGHPGPDGRLVLRTAAAAAGRRWWTGHDPRR